MSRTQTKWIDLDYYRAVKIQIGTDSAYRAIPIGEWLVLVGKGSTEREAANDLAASLEYLAKMIRQASLE